MHKIRARKGKGSFLEVNYNIKNPYFVKEDISDQNVLQIAKYMLRHDVITQKAYQKISDVYNKNPDGNNYAAEMRLINELKSKNIDGLAFMQEKYDAGSIGVMAFDENQVRVAARHTIDEKGNYKLSTAATVTKKGSISASEIRKRAVREKVNEILKDDKLAPIFKKFVEKHPGEFIDINNLGEYNDCKIVELKTFGEQKNINGINSKTGVKYKQLAYKLFDTIYIDNVPDFEKYTVYKCKLPIELWFAAQGTQRNETFKQFRNETQIKSKSNEKDDNNLKRSFKSVNVENYDCHHQNLILGEFGLVLSNFHDLIDHCGGNYSWPIMMDGMLEEFYKFLENER